MLSRSKLMKLLVDIASVNDVPILREDRNLPDEICAKEDRQTVRRMAELVADLVRNFDYERSAEFEEAIAGKSNAVATMKRRLASDPVKRFEQRKRLEHALGDVLSSDMAFMLVPREQHAVVRSLIELASRLRNPAD